MEASRPAVADRSGPATSESRALLGQCRELARAKLSRIISEALDKIESDLLSLADGTPSRTEQQVLLEAMAHVKQYRGDIATAFDRYFIEVFEKRIAARRAAAQTTTAELKLEELSLVTDEAIEEDLVVSDLARKTKNKVDPDQLLGIRARFGHLLSQTELDDSSNPLSPEAVFEALKLACARIPGAFAVKRSLLNAFQPYVAKGISYVYADVNQNLIAHRVLPRIRHTVQRARDSHGQSQPLGGNAMAGLSGAMPSGGADGKAPAGGIGSTHAMNLAQLLGATPEQTASQLMNLSQLLAGVLNGPPHARHQAVQLFADPARYSLESALETPATPALVASLSELQAQAAAALTATQGIQVLAALDQQVRASSHPLDQLTIELVSVVFDYILGDKSIPDTVKSEIARLQIVAVKAAILDRTFFARRQHPMRQFLDRVAEAATDPEINTSPGSKYIGELHGVVSAIIDNFKDDLSVFAAALELLQKMIDDEHAARQKAIEPTAVKLAEKERADIALSASLAEIKRRVTRKTPGFIREFLYNWWSKVLVDANINEREGDDSWVHRLGVVDALVWSVSPLQRSEIQQLAALLPNLMRSVLRGMNAVEMGADARHAFFNQLMQTHTATINAAKHQAKTAAAGEPASEVVQASAEPEPEAHTPDPEPPASDSEAALNDYFTRTVLALERGAVVEFLENEVPVRSKLSWVSPRQTILLFTANAAGARQLAPSALADMLRTGTARVLDASEALMDRVVQAIVNDASPAAA